MRGFFSTETDKNRTRHVLREPRRETRKTLRQVPASPRFAQDLTKTPGCGRSSAIFCYKF